ncbi:enoyl-CoA hydratase [Actinomadura sp. BRA 177]|uniref:enoyl-CoA hydratase n=1 Tax=Actinomadura sp. BRA 177 TaxID=2745202 RepID=UPI001595FC28|nr:enoyl-CoA hydratase [Actinomadura sp. BRA 177]NVI89068.1 enoyl-CoA hydratase [Actinomadura sp. BRA 177]
MMSDVLLLDRADGVATVTLNRPEVRNALSSVLINALRETMRALEDDAEVHAVVLTGADPAFCAGLDLKQLGSSGDNLQLGQEEDEGPSPYPWPVLSKPVIGAVNGVAVTGGLKLALNCDILVASERARFADTHARVGVLPGWGLSVLLPQLVGRQLARRMSLTGDFITAGEALRAGLVTEVVAHADLLPTAHRIARRIAANDHDAVRTLLDSYRRIELTQLAAGYDIEGRTSRDWLARGFAPASVEGRRRAIVDRGRAQNAP